jgi:AAA family ATP:ADP antiporter
MVATAFAVAQTQLVGEQVVKAGNQMLWFADVESITQGLTLVLQVTATGHLLRRFPQWSFLCLLPLLAIAGLSALWLFPVTLAVGIVQVLRRGGQFAFEKPARELLYTPFDLETKHKVKFVLDTVAFRFGDLLGAYYQLALREHAPGPGVVLAATIALAAAWIVLGLALGRRPAATAVHASA